MGYSYKMVKLVAINVSLRNPRGVATLISVGDTINIHFISSQLYSRKSRGRCLLMSPFELS